jgi:hypothetical protein
LKSSATVPLTFHAQCFHAFAAFTAELFILNPSDLEIYIYSEFYKKVTSLKTKGKTVLLALGGWNDSAGTYVILLL